MTPEEEARLVRKIYEAARRLDPEERPDYLDRACSGMPHIRAQVEALLEADSEGLRESEIRRSPSSLGPHEPENIEGRVIGQYIVRRELGRGGMGVVYLADDTKLSRQVALNAITPGLGRDSGGRERLRREARAAAGLSHPGIATVYALEEIADELYLACEYVPGEPLRALVESGPLPIRQVVTIGAQLARALAAAHTLGVVHRDIKPENVVKTPSGAVKVLDFGLARMDGATPSKLTQTGIIMGTPAYMAPEQALGQKVDFRTDLFAFGLLIYELASGVNPFVGKTVGATLARIVKQEPPPLSKVRPESPLELDRIVAICLHKDPLERYGSTEELVADFDGLEAEWLQLRQRTSDRGGQRPIGPMGETRAPTALWWWEFHQMAMSGIYVLMMYPTWLVQRWLDQPWGMIFLFAVLVSAAAATSLRLHLGFLARNVPEELAAQRTRTLAWVRMSDGGFSAAQFAGALGIGRAHPEFAMLFITIATVTFVGSLVIEPATARAAFGAPRAG